MTPIKIRKVKLKHRNMRNSTIQKYKNLLTQIKISGLSISKYCELNDIKVKAIYEAMHSIKENYEEESAEVRALFDLYQNITHKTSIKVETVTLETNDSEIDELTIVRNQDGKIVNYRFVIPVRDKADFIGELSREEVEQLFGLYTYYGGNITARNVANEFPRFTLSEIRKLFRCFKITKDTTWAAPHMLEEMNEEQLNDYRMNLKERAAMKYADSVQERSWNNLLKKVVTENNQLKKQLEDIESYNFNITSNPILLPDVKENSNKEMILYLADMHVGARIMSNPLYDENINYGEDEINRRLDECIKRIKSFGHLDTIHVCLMGDMMDSIGVTNKTVSLTHSLPENMDGYEQLEAYLNIIHRFVSNLAINEVANNIRMYSVRDGNHTGVFEHAATMALFASLEGNGIKCCLYKDFYGVMEIKNHTFVLTHGKTGNGFMKKGLPLNLDAGNKVRIYEWLDDKGISGNNIHIVKADLHSNNLNSCYKFDYRNVLSLFGSSDHSAYQFSRNAYGASFDLFIGDQLTQGTFNNL